MDKGPERKTHVLEAVARFARTPHPGDEQERIPTGLESNPGPKALGPGL